MVQEGGILRLLLTKIINDLNITSLRFHFLLNSYLEDPLNGISQTSHELSSARSNYAKEIKKSSLSWKWFIRTLKILQANRFTITITIHHDDNPENDTSHSVEVDLGRTYVAGEKNVERD